MATPASKTSVQPVSRVVSAAPALRDYVDWGAVFGASLISTASALLLTLAGVALGLGLFSPGVNSPGATTMSLAAAAWFSLTTLYAAGLGGYVVGRMRAPADDALPDEVAFRDGTNGLIVWGLGVVISAILAAFVITNLASTVVKAGANVVGSTVTTAIDAAGKTGIATGTFDYYIDRALRAQTPQTPASSSQALPEVHSEVTRILATSAFSGTIPDDDKSYLTRLVAERTGASEEDARKRIDTLIADTRAAVATAEATTKRVADQARKAGALAATWNAVVTLIAGLLAWYAATIGGFHRDQNRLA